MYNLLVTSKTGAWDSAVYEFDKSRFLEYTKEQIASALKALTPAHIENLKSYPRLFAYEGDDADVRIGNLTSVEEQSRSLRIKFAFQEGIAPIPFEKIKPATHLLDIREWEMNRTHWAVKDENLFDWLEELGILEGGFESNPTKQERPAAQKSTNPKVSTVQGFIGKVLDIDKQDGVEIFYRGHSNKKQFKLEPSLFRKDVNGNYLYLDNEHILYRELLVSNSADFQSDVYTLDRLVRMQHYSLPTRLLDITSNPLIALYFACTAFPGEDGEVILFTMNRRDIKYFDSDVASCIANLARLPKSEKDALDFNAEAFNLQPPVKRLLHFIREEKPFCEPGIRPDDLRKIVCVKGKQSNDRISSQSGAFLLFGLDAVFDENGTADITVSRITVSRKQSILKELDLLNINESTVFPYIENSAKYVAEKYKFNPSVETLAENGDG